VQYWKIAAFWAGLYAVVIILAVIGEFTYKKRTVAEVRQDFMRIIIKNAVIFTVFVAATYAWHFFSAK